MKIFESLYDKIHDYFLPTRLDYATAEEWDEWHKKAETSSKLVYKLLYRLPIYFSRLKRRLIDEPYDYVYFRCFKSFHKIDTGLKPGYYDIDTRMVHGMFSLLVYHVEYEKAHLQATLEEIKIKKKYSPFRFTKEKIDPKLGIEHLKWESSLNSDKNSQDYSPEQARVAKEILELYYWWKEREKEEDSSFISYHKFYQKGRNDIYDIINEITREKNEKETEMLIRLIKIRESLWT